MITVSSGKGVCAALPSRTGLRFIVARASAKGEQGKHSGYPMVSARATRKIFGSKVFHHGICWFECSDEITRRLGKRRTRKRRPQFTLPCNVAPGRNRLLGDEDRLSLVEVRPRRYVPADG